MPARLGGACLWVNRLQATHGRLLLYGHTLGDALEAGISSRPEHTGYFFGMTISSPTIDGLWWLQTMANVPGLSAFSTMRMTWPRFKTSVLS